jgi:hypothetical protein
MFGSLNLHLGFRGNGEVEMAVRDWLLLQEPNLYSDEFLFQTSDKM